MFWTADVFDVECFELPEAAWMFEIMGRCLSDWVEGHVI